MMKRAYIRIALAILGLVLPSLASAQSLRVLYWNIQNGMWADQENNYDNFVSWVKEMNPDICVWCEASTIYYSGTADVMPEEDRYLPANWSSLAARYGHPFSIVAAQRDEYPQVVTSRFPLQHVAALCGNGSDTLVVHGAGWIKAKTGDREMNFVTVHLKPFLYGYDVPKADRAESAARFEGEYFRIAEMDYIFDHTIRTRPAPDNENWFMMGDFNSRSRVDNYQYGWSEDSKRFMVHDHIAAKSPYRDLVAEKFPGEFQKTDGSGNRIDFVYVTPQLLDAISGVKVIHDGWAAHYKSGVSKFYRPSDHFPIVVDIDVSKIR